MPARKENKNNTDLIKEINELKIRLSETEETLTAIRRGEVDAIVVSGENGDKIFSLASSETPYRIIIEQMDEGAVTISANGIILYCNQRFSEIVSAPPEKTVGISFSEFISERDITEFERLLHDSTKRPVRGELSLAHSKKTIRLSLSPLPSNIEGDICIIVSDITEISNYQNYLREMVDERTSELKIANRHLNIDIEKLRSAEKALQDSEILFRSAFDEGAVPMILTSREGDFLKVNRAFSNLTGFSEKELLGMSYLDITHPDDLEPSIKGRDELEKNKMASFRLEKRYIRKDGKQVWVRISTAPVRDINGRWDFFVTHVQDINKRKIAENRLRESKERFKQLANSIPQLAWIARADGYIFWFNHRWFEYTGKKSDEMIGWGWQTVLQQKNIQNIINQWQSYINEGKPFEMVNSLLGSDGSYREFLSKSIPITDKKGQVDQWFGTHTDISELIKVENELNSSREKLNIALENGQIGTWEWNIVTDEVLWDERTEKMFGYEPGTFERTFTSFENNIHEEDLYHVRKTLRQSLNAGQQFETIFRSRPRNGECSYISVKALVTRDPRGNATNMSGVCFDVTRMKKEVDQALIRINEELLRSNKDLQQFAYVASHDLQEPLRMVSSFTQLLQHRYADKLGDEGNEYIHFAVEGSKRMYELLNGLLAYSRIQTKGREFAVVDMNRVVEKVKDNLNLIISETKTRISHSDLPEIVADENQMIQLIQNLFENSIKFRKEVAEISVSWQLRDDYYVFAIRDKGIGIEPQYFERIFRIFQRLHRSDEYEGTGIGLAICKRIVERHGGQIWVESEFGTGTTFFFSIPESVSVRSQLP
ncbi:MAG TPA: PAS domain S-box protein [Bacteroidales bacterium]|nr:PAS domain S-box protein [Bacteroidales bacterium]